MNFNWEEFEKGNIAVNFKEFNELCDFIKQCQKRNYSWVSGIEIYNNDCNVKESYIKYGKNLYYRFNPISKGLAYGDVKCYNSYNYKIIEWSDYMEQKFNWNDFKENKFAVLLTRGNYRDFLNHCRKHGINTIYNCTIENDKNKIFIQRYSDCSKLESNEFTLSCFKLYDEYRLQFDEETTNIVRWNNNLAKQEKSYIEQVANILNLELNEEFNIYIDENKLQTIFRLTNNGIEKRTFDNKWEILDGRLLNDILVNKVQVIKRY